MARSTRKRGTTKVVLALSALGSVILGSVAGAQTPEQIPPVPATPLPATPPATTQGSVRLVPYVDPWSLAQPRFRDIANREYAPTFRSGPQAFSYASANVTFTYDRQPATPYFSGHITAQGLKPNFAYQVKLAGKPVRGSRGAGTQTSFVGVNSSLSQASRVERLTRDQTGQLLPISGDDWANQQLGYAGRWWDETAPPSTNLTDKYYQANYPAHTIYGYLFMGDFVTDAEGNASTDLEARYAYHVTWQDGQKGAKNVPAGTFTAQSATPPYYGYGKAPALAEVKLWYEYQSDRPHEVQLAPGTYHCRILITEESFHGAGGSKGEGNGIIGIGPNSGVWKTVLASEKFGARTPANDIVFTLGP